MTHTIETLKAKYLALSTDCEAQYKRIQKALLTCKGIDNARIGYQSKWEMCNMLCDFLKVNSINFYTNYQSQTIDLPFSI